jgi:hypothetical protein
LNKFAKKTLLNKFAKKTLLNKTLHSGSGGLVRLIHSGTDPLWECLQISLPYEFNIFFKPIIDFQTILKIYPTLIGSSSQGLAAKGHHGKDLFVIKFYYK